MQEVETNGVMMCICGEAMGYASNTCDDCDGEPRESEAESEPCGGCGACREGWEGCSFLSW